MSELLPPVMRPNGKLYTPRKGLFKVGIDNAVTGEFQVLVGRTHDIDRARTVARPYVCAHLTNPTLSWARKSIRNHEPWWEWDEVRGVPCVVFTESDDPDEVTDG